MADEEAPNKQTAGPAPSIPASEPKKPNKLLKTLKKIIIVVVIAIVAIIALVFFLTKGASDAASQILSNIQSGECQLVYDSQSSQEFKTAVSQELWLDGCARVSEVLQGEPDQTGVNVQGESGEASRSIVEYEVRGTDELDYTVEIEMIKEDGDWKMFNFDSTVAN